MDVAGPRADPTAAALLGRDVELAQLYGLIDAIQRACAFDHLPTEEELAQVSDRWRPYRSLAVSYLFASEYDA